MYYVPMSRVTKIGIFNSNYRGGSDSKQVVKSDTIYTSYGQGWLTYQIQGVFSYYQGNGYRIWPDFAVSSSNPNVVGAVIAEADDGSKYLQVYRNTTGKGAGIALCALS